LIVGATLTLEASAIDIMSGPVAKRRSRLSGMTLPQLEI